MKQGRVDEAKNYLEKALRVDYQMQYQPDVNQYAIRATLAQSYEACNDLDKARLLYQSIVVSNERSASRTIKDYARGRLEAIALISGSLPEQEKIDTQEFLEFLNTIVQNARRTSNISESVQED